jgi:hypothetical protein
MRTGKSGGESSAFQSRKHGGSGPQGTNSIIYDETPEANDHSEYTQKVLENLDDHFGSI